MISNGEGGSTGVSSVIGNGEEPPISLIDNGEGSSTAHAHVADNGEGSSTGATSATDNEISHDDYMPATGGDIVVHRGIEAAGNDIEAEDSHGPESASLIEDMSLNEALGPSTEEKGKENAGSGFVVNPPDKELDPFQATQGNLFPHSRKFLLTSDSHGRRDTVP